MAFPQQSLRMMALVLALAVMPAAARADDALGIAPETETLGNGLSVIYAPMPSSPVTQVRVLYHVGSRDERSDRQGFAHMFEHMMFRGSEHVKPQEHMKLIGLVGGYCNANTGFDKTQYFDTLPSTDTNLALWLEADRMSSFKVSPQIFHTEQLVVAEEWRMRQNQPYGTMFEDLCNEIFKVHPYQWTPIGNMKQLQASSTSELQAFFNRYYVPSNAVLVIAGNTDLPAMKAAVHRYFSWIPEGNRVVRHIPQEPEQTEARREEVKMRVPLPLVAITYHMPSMLAEDDDALELLLSILGSGRSCRLSRALVTSADPLCVQADSLVEPLEDGGVMGVEGIVSHGKDPSAVEKILREQVAAAIANPVTDAELEKAKQQARLELAKRWKTVDSASEELGTEMLMRGNLDHVKAAKARIEAVTVADLQRIARKYFGETKASTLVIMPGNPAPTAEAVKAATSQPTTEPVAKEAPHVVQFPTDYPTTPPVPGTLPSATFEKGVEKVIDGVRVIVMTDHRLPIVNWSITTRMGGHAVPAGKEGLAGLTAEMVRRGPVGKTYDQFNEELDSRGITLEASDGGDFTRLAGSCLTEVLPFGLEATRSILLSPAFDPAQFATLKSQSLDALQLELNTPSSIGARELAHALYGNSPLGRLSTAESVGGLTLDDVKKFYASVYSAKDAILMISGDISVADGQKAAEQLLADFKATDLPKVDYPIPSPPEKTHIVVVDFAASKQAVINLGAPAYSLRSDEKFAGTLAGQILSNGIESRLGQYVRAEKGYVYGVDGQFAPGRQAGAFEGETGTKFETTADTVEAMFKVFDDMKNAPVTDKELSDAKLHMAGVMLMSMQTIEDQASRRVVCILNDYPLDYYDVYPLRLSKVTTDDIKTVMDKYVNENHMSVVVVAPAAAVKTQLEKLGTVEVLPPPSKE